MLTMAPLVPLKPYLMEMGADGTKEEDYEKAVNDVDKDILLGMEAYEIVVSSQVFL